VDDNLSKSRFLNSIDKYARKKCLKLAEEIRQIEKERLLKEEVKIVEQARTLMMSELADVKKKITIKIYKERTNALQKVYQRRLDMENEVFDACKLRLKKFTQSDKYFDKLKKSLNHASKILGDSFNALVRKEDIKRVKELQESLFPSVSFFEDDSIKLGGFIFKKGNIVLDDSFDYSLKRQRKFFSEKFSCKLV